MRKVRGAAAGVGAAGLFVAGLMLGGVVRGEAKEQDNQLVHFKCYPITEGGTNPPHVVALQDQFGKERRAVGQARMLCTPVFKRIVEGPEPRDIAGLHLKCYSIAGELQPPRVNLGNQFGIEENVALSPARLLCVPTAKRVAPPPERG